jgi:hypothetical protein
MVKREKKRRGETQTIDGGRGEIVIYQPGEPGGQLLHFLQQLKMKSLGIAESNPNQKDILTKVVVNLIKDRK